MTQLLYYTICSSGRCGAALQKVPLYLCRARKPHSSCGFSRQVPTLPPWGRVESEFMVCLHFELSTAALQEVYLVGQRAFFIVIRWGTRRGETIVCFVQPFPSVPQRSQNFLTHLLVQLCLPFLPILLCFLHKVTTQYHAIHIKDLFTPHRSATVKNNFLL